MPQTDRRISRPKLITRRLLLQPLKPRHAAQVHEAIEKSRPALRRWLPFAARQQAAETLGFIRRVTRNPAHCVWGIWERGDGRGALYCGSVGLHGIDREQAVATLGYWTRTSRAGRGYMTEAAAAVLLWAFGPLGLERLSVQAAPGNPASLRVIEKLGFVREGLLREMQRIPGRRARLDWVTFGMTRSDRRRAGRRLALQCGVARPWEPPLRAPRFQRMTVRRPERSVPATSRRQA